MLAVLAATALVAQAAGTGPAHGTTVPILRVLPNPSVSGTTVTAYGAGFCPSACGDVTITVDGKVVAARVQVHGDGTFDARFRRIGPTGQFVAVASQRDGPAASAGMRVVPNDQALASSTGPKPPSSHTSQPKRHGSTATATSTGRRTPSPERPTPTPAPTSGRRTATPAGPLAAKNASESGTASHGSAGTLWWVWAVIGAAALALIGAAWGARHRRLKSP